MDKFDYMKRSKERDVMYEWMKGGTNKNMTLI